MRKLTTTRSLLATLAAAALFALAGPAAANAEAPQWKLDSRSAPTFLVPGATEPQQIRVVALNLGDAEANPPITLSDRLPAGLTATAVALRAGVTQREKGHEFGCLAPPALSCTWTGPKLPPYERLEMIITVQVKSDASSGEENEVKVEGGNTPSASLRRPITVSSASTPFGIENYELRPENEDGSLDLQAGSHPFQLTSHLDFNQTLAPNQQFGLHPGAPAIAKDLHFSLPPGLVGDANPNAPNAVAQCSIVDFTTTTESNKNLCPAGAAVGVASVSLYGPVGTILFVTKSVPVYNLVPGPGEPARFGFETSGVPVYLDTELRTGQDYAVVVSVRNASQAVELLSSDVTFWGVPGDSRHDQSRGWNCVLGGVYIEGEAGKTCQNVPQTQPLAYLTLPTSCEEQPKTSITGDSWPTSGNPAGSELTGNRSYTFPSSLGGCNALPFGPSLEVQPDQHAASTPTGVKVKVKVPQETTLQAKGLAEAAVRQTTVVLPEGLLSSPGAAGGLLACGTSSVGLQGGVGESAQLENDHFSPDKATCPDASRIGGVRINTPLLPNELTGSVYLAEQDTNPFASPLVLYLIAEDPVSGVRVKLAGEVQVNASTGQLTSVFRNTPQVPFEELQLELYDGPRATNSTPPQCGSYTTTSSFVPWSGTGAASPSSSFNIDTGAGGGSCPGNPLPFTPSFQAGATNNQAGGFTPFTVSISHPDADQALQGLTMHLPPGVAAMLSSVTPCPEPQAAQGTCGSASLVGHTTTSSGLGGSPFSLGGQVYLTGPYKGAPFGLSVVTPAVAGPFNLGNVIVRSTINVDPNTAAVAITSDSFPTILKGVPVQLKQLSVTIDRPGFQFNPTNCNAMTITGTLTGAQGTSAAVSSPFQVANCARLPFSPKLTASTQGNASKPNGASLKVTVTATPGQANIAKTTLRLPVALPSRLTTIQKACIDSVFEKNPASCPEGSNIGTATVHTPVLKNTLTGPAYLVSHGGAAFPDVEFVLQGEGITLVLDGKTDIKKGITTSSFNAVPDAPVTTFETVLPEGPHSALTSNVPESRRFSLCGTKLVMPTTITGQNGAVIKQETRIPVTGCKSVKAFKATRAQRLAKALKACRKNSNKSKRAACEKQARKAYGAKAKSKKRK